MADNKNSGKPQTGYNSRILNYASNLLVSAMEIPSYIKPISDIGIDFTLLVKKTRVGISRKESVD